MKVIFLFLLLANFLLSACGQAPVEPVTSDYLAGVTPVPYGSNAEMILKGYDNSTGKPGLLAYRQAVAALDPTKKQAISDLYISMGYPVPPGGIDSTIAAAGPALSSTSQGEAALRSILGI